MNKESGFITTLLLCTGIIIICLYISTYKLLQVKYLETTNLALLGQNQFSMDYPPLPAGFDWEKEVLDEKAAEEKGYQIFYDNRYENVPIQQHTTKSINVSGTVYTTSIDYEDGQNTTNPFIVYMKALQDNGWKWDYDIKPYYVFGTSADGVGASIVGLLKGTTSNMKTAIISYNLKPQSITMEDDLKFNCPCTLEVSIFQSNPTKIIFTE